MRQFLKKELGLRTISLERECILDHPLGQENGGLRFSVTSTNNERDERLPYINARFQVTVINNPAEYLFFFLSLLSFSFISTKQGVWPAVVAVTALFTWAAWL